MKISNNCISFGIVMRFSWDPWGRQNENSSRNFNNEILIPILNEQKSKGNFNLKSVHISHLLMVVAVSTRKTGGDDGDDDNDGCGCNAIPHSENVNVFHQTHKISSHYTHTHTWLWKKKRTEIMGNNTQKHKHSHAHIHMHTKHTTTMEIGKITATRCETTLDKSHRYWFPLFSNKSTFHKRSDV